MGSLSKIVLPVDFSERSVGAARYAKALAGHFGSELILLHVLMPPQYEFGALDIGGSMLAELYRNQASQASREMEALVSAELPGVNARRVVLEGDPARCIVDFAQAEQADLILMPTHGYGPFRRFILGSNTAKVLHDADCPVWTGVHLEDAPAAIPLPLRSVLCAVDLGPQSSKTLCWAALLAREFGAPLTLLHVTTCEPDYGDDSEVNWRVDVREAARAELQRLTGFVRVEAECVVEGGEPSKVICAAAARMGAGLVVIGRGSAAGVFGRLRTHAYAIIRESPSPVVSV
jgi:nucleotide-binding universal stress UspA family protein